MYNAINQKVGELEEALEHRIENEKDFAAQSRHNYDMFMKEYLGRVELEKRIDVAVALLKYADSTHGNPVVSPFFREAVNILNGKLV